MRLALSLLVVLGCAASAAAQEAGAPLSNTKQQLQTLSKDQSAQKSGENSDLGLRNALPGINAPTPPIDLALPKPPENERDRKDGRKGKDQKNWLLDGYDKLDRKRTGAQAGVRGRDDKLEELDEEPLDPRDPDYFLRVYEKQREESLAKQEQQQLRADAANSTTSSAGNDAFAPFMKEWLAGSPVGDALRDSLGGARAGQSGSVVETGALPGAARPESRETTTLNVTGLLGGGESKSGAGPASNPFIQALGLGAAAESKPLEMQSPVAEPVVLPPRPAAPELTLPEKAKTDTNFRPPPSPADDKKYFPQLKKF